MFENTTRKKRFQVLILILPAGRYWAADQSLRQAVPGKRLFGKQYRVNLQLNTYTYKMQ